MVSTLSCEGVWVGWIGYGKAVMERRGVQWSSWYKYASVYTSWCKLVQVGASRCKSVQVGSYALVKESGGVVQFVERGWYDSVPTLVLSTKYCTVRLTVQCLNSVRIVSCTRLSVCESTALGSPVEKCVSWVRIRRKKVKYQERLRQIVE